MVGIGHVGAGVGRQRKIVDTHPRVIPAKRGRKNGGGLSPRSRHLPDNTPAPLSRHTAPPDKRAVAKWCAIAFLQWHSHRALASGERCRANGAFQFCRQPAAADLTAPAAAARASATAHARLLAARQRSWRISGSISTAQRELRRGVASAVAVHQWADLRSSRQHRARATPLGAFFCGGAGKS
jgi:hypothetical protein